RPLVQTPEAGMGALLVGTLGVLTVAIAGTIAYRGSKTADDRMFHLHHNFTFGMSFVIFFVVQGILAVCDVIDDPIFGGGPTFPLVTILLGVVGVLAVTIVGVIVVRKNKLPAKRAFLIRLHVYMGVSFLLFFTAPGLLADLGVIPDPMPGLGTAVDLFFFFFLIRWAHWQLEKLRQAEAAGMDALGNAVRVQTPEPQDLAVTASPSAPAPRASSSARPS